MSHTSMILTGLMMMAMVVFLAPNIFALNRGHILRNVALWLAIFFALALIYQTFGPESPHPLFQAPASMAGMNKKEVPKFLVPAPEKDGNDNGEQGYTPPKE
jgi:hypothetical protein